MKFKTLENSGKINIFILIMLLLINSCKENSNYYIDILGFSKYNSIKIQSNNKLVFKKKYQKNMFNKNFLNENINFTINDKYAPCKIFINADRYSFYIIEPSIENKINYWQFISPDIGFPIIYNYKKFKSIDKLNNNKTEDISNNGMLKEYLVIELFLLVKKDDSCKMNINGIEIFNDVFNISDNDDYKKNEWFDIYTWIYFSNTYIDSNYKITISINDIKRQLFDKFIRNKYWFIGYYDNKITVYDNYQIDSIGIMRKKKFNF